MAETAEVSIGKPVTKEQLLEFLRTEVKDPEAHHSDSESALLRYINDPEISDAWCEASADWWYA